MLHSTDGHTWAAVPTNVQNDLHAVTCSDGNMAAVGKGGIVLRSSEGSQWIQATTSGEELLSVYGVGHSRKLWAVGSKGTILHTDDGNNWEKQDSPVKTTLRSIAGNETGIWVVGDGGSVLHSTDGSHWSKQLGPGSDLRSIFVATNGLWALSRKGIYHASGSGTDWTLQYASNSSDVLLGLFGDADGKRIWAVGFRGLILHTANGANWTTAVPASTNGLSVLAAGAATKNGEDAWAVGSSMKIIHAPASGDWQTQLEASERLFIKGVAGSENGTQLWFVGSGFRGNAIYSPDGAMWEVRTIDIAGAEHTMWVPEIEAVALSGDQANVWAVGSRYGSGGKLFRATVFHSKDGGKSWTTPFLTENSTLNSVIATAEGMTSVGSDSGAGFIVSCGIDDHCTSEHLEGGYLNSISGSADGKRLWAVGYGGTVWCLEGGKRLRLSTPTPETLTAVFATGKHAEKIFAVGDYGTILRSDNGRDWIQRNPTKVDLRSVFFTEDGKTGWVTGDFSLVDSRVRPAERSGAKLLQTTDGGEHWAERTVSDRPVALYGTADGRTLWIGGDTSWRAHATDKPAIYLKTARLAGTPERARLILTLNANPVDQKNLHISLSALNDFKYTKHWTPQDFKYKLSRSGMQDATWTATFDPSDLEISSGTIGHFYIDVTADGFSQMYEFGELYDPWRWVIDHRVGLSTTAGIIAVFATLYLLLFFKPLGILWVYFVLKQTPMDKLFRIPVAGSVLEFVFSLCTFGLPWFVTHKRTLDAWVTAYRDSITTQWTRETLPPRASASAQQLTMEATPYVPLPLQAAGEIIPQPAADTLSRFFAARRTVIEIIGPGGAGKTTLARQCGLWALAGGKPGGLLGHPMIPVWIDEEMENGRSLPQIVKGKLAALLPEAKLDDAFLAALLEKQRLLIIIDRLSEKSATTRQYVAGVYSSTRVEAMLITSREFLPITGASPTTLCPQALDEVTLLYFMFALLQPPNPVGKEEDKRSEHRVGMPIDDQLALATKLRDLYRESAGADKNILPLPVRFFVEEAKHALDASQSLDSLPQSIPEIYLRYLEQINPDNPSVPNYMGQTEMIRAAILLAKLALADDFIPKEFDRSDAGEELKKAGWDMQKLDPVQRLLDNGVLTSKGPIVSRRLKFVLDPVAEQLAAIAYFRESRRDAASLQAIRDHAQAASGFLRALGLLANQMPNQAVDVGRVERASSSSN